MQLYFIILIVLPYFIDNTDFLIFILFSVQIKDSEERLKSAERKLEKLLKNYGEQLIQLKSLDLGHLNYMRERVGEI